MRLCNTKCIVGKLERSLKQTREAQVKSTEDVKEACSRTVCCVGGDVQHQSTGWSRECCCCPTRGNKRSAWAELQGEWLESLSLLPGLSILSCGFEMLTVPLGHTPTVGHGPLPKQPLLGFDS